MPLNAWVCYFSCRTYNHANIIIIMSQHNVRYAKPRVWQHSAVVIAHAFCHGYSSLQLLFHSNGIISLAALLFLISLFICFWKRMSMYKTIKYMDSSISAFTLQWTQLSLKVLIWENCDKPPQVVIFPASLSKLIKCWFTKGLSEICSLGRFFVQ